MKGFTIIELLIVLGISAMLAGIAVVYTGVARNETALSVEAAKTAGFIFRAKDLAVATYNAHPAPGSPKVCGYGVSFNIAAGTYSLFAYQPDPVKYPTSSQGGVLVSCPDSGSITAIEPSAEEGSVSSDTWNVPLASGVKMLAPAPSDELRLVLFYPPNPATLMSNDGTDLVTSTSRLYLATADGAASTTVSVTGSGQVTF